MLEEGPCPECGADDWETVKADWSDRVRGWFRTGRRRGAESSQTRCRLCGFGIGTAVLYEQMPQHWWRAPARLMGTILDHRSMIPAPYIYVVSLALGVVIGIGVDAWLGWPWWLVALVFVFLVWLAFLSTAFIGPMRGRRLRDELLDAIDPRGAADRRERKYERLIRNCPFPLFGLDSSWTGLRSIGGSTDDGKTLSTLELAFGDHFSMDPWIKVGTSTAGEGREFDLRYWAIELWRRAEHPPPNLPPHQRSAWGDRRIDEHIAREADWSKVSIPVDRLATAFDLLQEGADWVAHTAIRELVVTVEGHLFPIESARLETVTDVEPYIEGSRRYEDEQRRRHEQSEDE